ncbi:MAG: signal peptidase [Microbacteriaceae bacterium]|jgi:signal peptidase I|nr:lepB [Leifsonia sp.]MDQ1580138.1 signal peptidase [Microbacteriaceae bacterium]
MVFIRDILVIFAVAVLVSFLIKSFVVRSFYIPSPSMVNTLQVNDRIIVNELEPSLIPIQHGDIVVFKDPGGWLPNLPQPPQNPVAGAIDSALTFIGLSAADSDDHLVKRTIGLPGDQVSCCNALGQLTVNGVPLKEPYITLQPGEQNAASVYFSVTVPKGMLWVMGDNRWNSQDSSRNQDLPGKGFVPESDVVGRAFVVSWPANHWTGLDNYPEVFRGVEDARSG